MCLIINTNKKTPPKKKFMWKYVSWDMSPAWGYRSEKYILNEWYESTREHRTLSKQEIISGEVHRGVHVYFTKKAAERECSGHERLLKVEVRPEDWVASDSDQAVYFRVKPVAVIH
jgi:hypothetical protein